MTTPKLHLAAWRAHRTLSQTDLARRCGVRQATISDLETGKAKVIRFALLGQIATALRCAPWELWRGPPR